MGGARACTWYRLYDRRVLRVRHIRFACDDPHALAGFWAAILGYETRSEGDRLIAADPHGDGPALAFERGPKSPTIELPIHLDVNVPDREAGVRHALDLGGRIVETKTSDYGAFSETFTVMRDLEGNGFCVQSPDSRPPSPYVGNVTFSCAEPRRVLGPFWSQALGWPEQAVGDDLVQKLRDAGIDVDREYYAIYAIRSDAPGQPRFLFQRRERSRPEHYPIRLELASDDLDRDLERLTQAGAGIVERDGDRAVVRDLEGNPFTVA